MSIGKIHSGASSSLAVCVCVYRSVAEVHEEGSTAVPQQTPKPTVKQEPTKSTKSQLALLVGAVRTKRQK